MDEVVSEIVEGVEAVSVEADSAIAEAEVVEEDLGIEEEVEVDSTIEEEVEAGSEIVVVVAAVDLETEMVAAGAALATEVNSHICN